MRKQHYLYKEAIVSGGLFVGTIIGLALTIILCLSSCEKEKPYYSDTFRFNVEEPDTKTAVKPLFRNNDRVGLYAVKRNADGSIGTLLPSGNFVNNKEYKYRDGRLVPGDGQEIVNPNPGADRFDFYAYYPYQSTVVDARRLSHSVTTNVGTSDGTSDLLYGKEQSGKTAGAISIDFTHRLGAIRMTLTSSFGGITATLNNVVRDCELNLASGTVTTGSTRANLSIASSAVSPDNFFECVLPPQRLPAGAEFLTVKDNAGTTATYLSTAALDVKSGQLHQYTLDKPLDKKFVVKAKPDAAAGGSIQNQTALAAGVSCFANTTYTLVANAANPAYLFRGWYNGAAQLTADPTYAFKVTAHVDYTAKYELKGYTVTFNANGGNGWMAPQAFMHGIAQPLSPNAFSRDGHSFAGWATSPGGGVVYTNGQTITVTADMTLYAVWQVNTYTVSFNANGGNGWMAPQAFTHGIAQPLSPNAFYLGGYTVIGWATSPGGGVVYTNGQTITVTADMTLYAVWQVNTYTVSFNANGGNGWMAPQSFTHSVPQALAWNAFSRANYTFEGWATSPGGGVVYANGQTIYANADMTLYAVWKLNAFTVTFNANGGIGSMSPQSFTPGVPQPLASNAFSMPRFEFRGWATSPDGAVIYTNQQTISIGADMTLFAVWEARIE